MKIIFTLSVGIIFSMNGFGQAPAIQWQHSLGGTLEDRANCVRQASDGGYIVGGISWSSDGDITGHHGTNSFFDWWVTKLDASGNLQWEKSYGGTRDDYLGDVEQTPDGGFILAGGSNSNDGDVIGNHGPVGFQDVWVVKINSSGNIQWQKCYGGTSDDRANDIDLTPDGGYIIAGYAGSANGDVTLNHGGYDYWIIKTDSAGTIQWQKTYGGSAFDYAYSIVPSEEGGYVAAGWCQSNDGDVTGHHGSTGVMDYWAIKIDSIGNLLWQRSLGGSQDDRAHSVHPSPDAGYIVTGYSKSTDGDVTGHHGSILYHDYWVVKLNGSGAIQWKKSPGGGADDQALASERTYDGGSVLGGWTYSNNGDVTGFHASSYADYWIVKLDTGGTIQWQKCLGGTDSDGGTSVMQTSDLGFIVAGYSKSTDGDVTGNHGNFDFWVVKLASPATADEIKSERNEGFISPNPATNELRINPDASGAELRIEEVEIYNVLGEKFFSQQPIANSQEPISINISSLPSGLYFLKLKTDGGLKTVKFVKAAGF